MLQHEELARSDERRLRNLDKESLRLLELRSKTEERDNFLPKTYRDPFAVDTSAIYRAAFARLSI